MKRVLSALRWLLHLKDTLVAELTAAGVYDLASHYVINGQLTDSQIDAAIGTGTGRLAARFTVTNRGRVVYDKEVAAEASWESSFMGAVAIPMAMNQYGALYKTLVAKLVDDPDFRSAKQERAQGRAKGMLFDVRREYGVDYH